MRTGTNLRQLMIDRGALELHGHFDLEMEGFLEKMKQQGIKILDVSKGWPKDIPRESTLVLCDCQDTVDAAEKRSLAVLGYIPIEEGQTTAYRPENPGDSGSPQPEGQTSSGPIVSQPESPLIQSPLHVVAEGLEEVDTSFLNRVLLRHLGLPWEILETERCLVREVTMEDVPSLFRLYDPPEVTRYLEGLKPTLEEEISYVEDYITYMYQFYGYGMWIVEEKSTGAVIGRAGFSHLEVNDKVQLELGYMIGLPYQRKGYAYEVCRGILDYAKVELNFESIHCLIHPDNLPSIRLAEKLGFSYDRNVLCNGKEMERYSLQNS